MSSNTTLLISQRKLAEIAAKWGEDYEPAYRKSSCAVCGNEDTEFYHCWFIGNGYKKEIHLCLSCAKPYEYTYSWVDNDSYQVAHLDFRRKWMNLQKDRPCKDCGREFPAVAMQFAHVRGTKEFNIATNQQLSMKRILAEIEKCDIICTNCNALRNYADFEPTKRVTRSKLRQLKNKPCADCEEVYPTYVMQFDHTGKDKSFNIGHRQDNELALLEAKKCEVVCANCHAIRTMHRGQYANNWKDA